MATKMTREEAIKIVQSATVWTDEERDALAMLIPELAESEDERIRRKMIEHFKAKTKETWCNMPVKDIVAYLEKQKEQKPWKVGANAYFTPEQKPAEWSEDDEKMLERAIHIIVEYSDIDEEESEIVQNWLKSLRPSWKPSEVCYGPNGDPDPAGVWKPSEEQMEALLSTLHPDDPYYCELRSLYEQLKKL